MVPITCIIVFAYLWIRFPLHPKSMYVSGVYFSNWSVYGPKHFPSDVDLAHVSHVFYAFMQVDGATGKVSLSDSWADAELEVDGENGCLGLWMALKEKHRHLKVVMSIGGWGTSHAFQETGRSPQKLQKFVESVGDLVAKYKFDGVDIDWEYPASAGEGAQLCEMLEMLRDSLDNIRGDMLLTVAAPASSSHLDNYHMGRMDRVLSFWNVMCYDFTGAGWSSKTGTHLNLYGHNGDNDLNVDLVIGEYISRGIRPHKIVMGMPMYGRSFYTPTSPDIGVSFNHNLPYPTDTVDYYEISPETEKYDGKRVAAHMYDAEKRLFITYDNPQCVAEKARYVTAHGLGGGFWWDSKGEARNSNRKLVEVFVEQVGGAQLLDHTLNWV